MRYEIETDGWEQLIEAISGAGPQEYQIAIGESERQLLVTWEPIVKGEVYRLFIEGAAHTITLLPDNRAGAPLRFLFDHRYVELDVKDEVDQLMSSVENNQGALGRQEIRSVMPGVIRKILKTEGDTVADGEPLFILEAMKMENEVPSPAAGILKRVPIQEGQTVATGELLAVVDRQ